MTATRLCNVEYKSDEDGTIRLCGEGEQKPAAYKRAGLLVCKECWPTIMGHFIGKYPVKHAWIAKLAVEKTFKRVSS